MRAVVAIAASWVASAQDQGQPLHIGPGITPPRVIHKEEPKYSALARADHAQGTVVLSVVVDTQGLARDIQVISPLGFGLDENAEEALGKWRFAPGMKDGMPVPIFASVEVNFRFPQMWFDQKAEQRRTSFNVALEHLNGTNSVAKDAAIKTMQRLAEEQFPPAMHLVGLWKMNGDNNVIKDAAGGWSLILKASEKNYGPALYEVAIRSIQAGGDPAAMEKQWQTLRDAAILGSSQAQFFLGQAYEVGSGVPKEPDRARRYFRLCATKGEPLCEFWLGRLLLDKADRSDDDYVQALAWLQLAADKRIAEARSIIEREQPILSSAQAKLVSNWKSQLAANH